MKFSSLLGMSSVAVLCMAAGTASAATIGFTLTSGFGNFANGSPATGATGFTDYFTFDMPSTATGGLSGIHVNGGSSLIDFTYLGLFQGAVGSGTLVSSVSSIIGAATLDLTSFILPAANPYPNAYYLQVTGKDMATTGLNPGYGGTIAVSPVPEPKTYAMLLAGLGLLAFTARRRRTSFF